MNTYKFDLLLPKKWKDGKCPECQTKLEFDPGYPSDFYGPGMPDVWYCPECGWELDDAPDYQKYPIVNEVTDSLWKKIQEHENKAYTKTSWLSMFTNAPSKDFEWRSEIAGDWYAIKGCEGWWKLAYATHIGRKKGKCWVEVETCDSNGNWDLYLAWEEGESWDELGQYFASSSDKYFLGWAKYWLYCARHGIDPLDQCTKSFNTSDDYYEFCIEAVREELKYLNM